MIFGWLKKRVTDGAATPDREKREMRQEQLEIAARIQTVEQRRQVMTRKEKKT